LIGSCLLGTLFITLFTSRKTVIYISTVFMTLSSTLLIFLKTFPGALAVSSLFGCGYGPFVACEFAMLMDVLPVPEDAAKDIALWHSALVVPQIVATPVAGWLLDVFQSVGKKSGSHCLGYNVVFSICILYFLMGADCTRRINLP
jgi:MFS family permease